MKEAAEREGAPYGTPLRTAKGVRGQRERPARGLANAVAILAVIVAATGCAAQAQAPESTASHAGVRFPVCASHLTSASPAPSVVKPSGNVPVPGNPVGAVLCRYAGKHEQQPLGALAGAARVTSHSQVTQLQSAMNASKALQGTTMGCFQSNGDAASVIIIYPEGTPNLTVDYVPACLALVEGSREFLVSDSFVNLLEDRTGSWK